MRYYVGFDVSDKQTSVCVLFADGNLAWQGEVDTGLEFISSALSHWGEEIDLVGLETGSLTLRLARSLRDAGLPIVVMDTRRAADAIKARPVKTDRLDARALAEMLRTGWFTVPDPQGKAQRPRGRHHFSGGAKRLCRAWHL